MARSLSKTKALSPEDREILRAIYYRQRIPAHIVVSESSTLANRLKLFELAGLISREGNTFTLTDAGASVLKRAYRGQKPPMIDFKHSARLRRTQIKEEFIVGSSLASEIAREASISE